MSAAIRRQQILLQRKAGIAPHVLIGERRAHAPDERQKRALVVRLERLAAQERQPVYIARRERFYQLFFRLRREGLPVMEIPRFGLKAVLAVIGAAGNEQAHPHAQSVGDVGLFDVSVVHKAAFFE